MLILRQRLRAVMQPDGMDMGGGRGGVTTGQQNGLLGTNAVLLAVSVPVLAVGIAIAAGFRRRR
ncbi:MAG: hypothetical protein E7450_00645 [Ruminococcaceae bacterium]|nr:hypothetical protein [Oscillospiraceae bacterium]